MNTLIFSLDSEDSLWPLGKETNNMPKDEEGIGTPDQVEKWDKHFNQKPSDTPKASQRPEVGSTDWMGGWRAITESVDSQPAEDVPVWLYLPNIGQPIIGCSVYNEGWLWARCYGGFYYDKDAREWKTDDAEEDDLAPSHWMPLPKPPIKKVSRRSESEHGQHGEQTNGR